MKRPLKFYWHLLIYTFQLSAFTFGGGYVIVPLMKKRFVDQLAWIDEDEMLDFMAIAQSSPGAVAVNAATLLGYNLAGYSGAAVAILGTILPPLILLTLISIAYSAFISNPLVNHVLMGMQAGVAAVIVDVVIDMARTIVKDKKKLAIILMIFAFIAVSFLNINIILIIIFCIVLGLLNHQKEKKEIR